MPVPSASHCTLGGESFPKAHTPVRCFATEKSPLATLRKRTGYSFVNCKKALELHSNDVVKAEAWLKEQAQALGWAKATKLEGRITTQGLVGVLLQKSIGAIVEVNCETDFVARNDKFREFVQLATESCLKYVNDLPESDLLSRTEFQSESLKNLLSSGGNKLSDELALMIGSVGENASLGRAVCFKVPESVQLTGMAYPTETNVLATEGQVQLGIYGAVLGLKAPEIVSADVSKDLCLHVIGMNPAKVGNKEQDKPAEDKDEETCLIHQEYIFDADLTVGEFLENNQIEIVDYQRFRCGEKLKGEENLDAAAAAN